MSALVALIVLAASLSSIVGGVSSSTPRDQAVSADEFSKLKFHYIVAGGGTAGVVVAARLSENPDIRVGLLEAGIYRKDDPLIDVPAEAGRAFGNPDYDWNLVSTPQPGLNGRVIHQTRGKVLGGSSALNTFTWQRPSTADFDIWAHDFENGPEWTFKALLPYYKKSENWTFPPLVLPGQTNPPSLRRAHGLGGPMAISYNNFFPTSMITSTVASNTLGIPTNSNPDLGNQGNITITARSVDPATGKRSYSAPAFYEPNAHRPNFVVLTGAHITKIVFSKPVDRRKSVKPVATGVEYVVNGRTYIAFVTKEVILSAGAFNTPQILELSGVGNKAMLQKFRIPIVLDLPQVGENLQEHTSLPSQFIVKPNVITLDNLRWNMTYARKQKRLYDTKHIGADTYSTSVLSGIPLQSYIRPSDMHELAAVFDRSAIAKDALQKVQYRVLKRSFVEASPWVVFAVVASALGFSATGNNSYLSPISLNYHPIARGNVHINTSDPFASVVINPNFLDNDFDVAVHSYAASYTRTWFRTAPIVNDIASQEAPSDQVQSRDDFNRYTRDTIRTTYHPFGTTPMAPLKFGGVVDPQLKVHGLSNVRIVDAGVFPATISAALQPTVYAIAEKAADMIKESFETSR